MERNGSGARFFAIVAKIGNALTQLMNALLITAANSIEFEGLHQDEETLAYLPMAWVGDHIFSYAQAYVAGFCVSCPESPTTVMTDLREIGPTYFFAPHVRAFFRVKGWRGPALAVLIGAMGFALLLGADALAGAVAG